MGGCDFKQSFHPHRLFKDDYIFDVGVFSISFLVAYSIIMPKNPTKVQFRTFSKSYLFDFIVLN